MKQQDVEELPDPALLGDYLGIGAKEQEREVYTKCDKRRVKAPYVPVKPVTRSGTGTSTPVSR